MGESRVLGRGLMVANGPIACLVIGLVGCTELDPRYLAEEGGGTTTVLTTTESTSSSSGGETSSSTGLGHTSSESSTTAVIVTESSSSSSTWSSESESTTGPIDLLPCDDVALEEDFEDGTLDLAILAWGSDAASVVEQDGKLQWPVVPGDASNTGVTFGSASSELGHSQVTIALEPVLADPGLVLYFEISRGACLLHFRIENGVIRVKDQPATAEVYRPLDHRWLRIRGTGKGTFAFEVAPAAAENEPLAWDTWAVVNDCGVQNGQVHVMTNVGPQIASQSVIALDRFQWCLL